MIAAPYIGAYCAYYFGFRWIANYLYVEYILIFVFSSAGYVVFAFYDPLWRWVSTWLYLVPQPIVKGVKVLQRTFTTKEDELVVLVFNKEDKKKLWVLFLCFIMSNIMFLQWNNFQFSIEV